MTGQQIINQFKKKSVKQLKIQSIDSTVQFSKIGGKIKNKNCKLLHFPQLMTTVSK